MGALKRVNFQRLMSCCVIETIIYLPNSPTIRRMKNKHLIVVLGMHRSGSSAITKGLEVMGVELGTQLMPANVNNVTGYFEDIEINQLNIGLLKTKGHDWSTLTPIKSDDFQGDQFTPFKTRATDVLRSKLKNSNILGIKDPRLCRLLPFWMEIFSDLKLKVSYVIILRNPDDIAASLFKRDSIPRVKSLYLWMEHMLPVFQETTGLDRTILDYDELISNPQLAIETLAIQLGLEKEFNQQKLSSYATDFIDPDLRHHQVTSDPEKEFTPRIIKKLASLLSYAKKEKASFDSVKFNTEIKRIEKEYRDRSDLLHYIDALDSIVLRDHHHRADIETKLGSLSESLEKEKSRLKSKKKTLTVRNLQIRKFKELIREQHELLSSLKCTLVDHESGIEALGLSLENREAKIKQLLSQKIDSDIQVQKLNELIQSAVSDTENLSQQLDNIKSSLYWKLSFLSRSLWHIVESNFASKKEKFHLIPVNELNRLRIADNSWQSIGTDPFFRLVPTSGRMPSGWFEIKTCLQTDSIESSLKLYLDCGQGLNEETSYTIPVLSQGAINELVFLPNNLQSLRWDPMQKEGEFKQAPILFVRKTWFTRKFQMMKRVISVLASTSPNLKKENNLSWKLMFSELNNAYAAAGKVIISRHDNKIKQVA